MRPSAVAIAACLILTGFTVWITRQAKALESDLDGFSRRVAILDKPAPDFTLTASDGRTVSLAGYRGRKLVTVFWATWNNGSHPELFMLGLLYQRSHTPDSDYDIVGVAVDDDLPAVKQFAADNKIAFPLVLDRNRQVTDAFKIRSLPTTLIIGPDGKVSYGSVGLDQGEFARRLGLRPGEMRMEMMGVRGGRGN